MEADFINYLRNELLDYFSSECEYLTRDSIANILSNFNSDVSNNHCPEGVFLRLLTMWGNSTEPDAILAAANKRYDAKLSTNASKLDDSKPLSMFEAHQLKLKKKYKIDGLAFEGITLDKPKEDVKPEVIKQSPETSVGHSKQVRFNNKTIIFAMEIR